MENRAVAAFMPFRLAAFRIEPWLTEALAELDTHLDQDMGRLVQWRYGPAAHREVCPPLPTDYPRVTSDAKEQ